MSEIPNLFELEKNLNTKYVGRKLTASLKREIETVLKGWLLDIGLPEDSHTVVQDNRKLFIEKT